MGLGELFSQNWFDLIETVGIVGGLCFTAISLRSETKTRRIANLLTITANHREIWKEFLNNPKLARVRDAGADTIKQPVTDAERVFVTFVILHMSSVFHAMSDQLVVKVEGLRRDIAQFFSLPITREVWDKIKVLQNDEFVAFVEGCRNWK
jgi:hypothetical protein